MSNLIVQTNGLCKRYRTGSAIVHAVSNVSLSIDEGEFIAIVGRSGSGKSTLMSLIGLLERADAGEYCLKGRAVAELGDRERAMLRSRAIGFVFQLASLLPRHTAQENVELPLIYAGIHPAERHCRAEAALEWVGLSERRHHWPNQLSGGEQQRVAIARALINNPDLILADEPTGSLDSTTADVILAFLENLNRAGRTIVIVTHSMEIAKRMHRRITIDDGRIIDDDKPKCDSVVPIPLLSAVGER